MLRRAPIITITSSFVLSTSTVISRFHSPVKIPNTLLAGAAEPAPVHDAGSTEAPAAAAAESTQAAMGKQIGALQLAAPTFGD